MCSLANVNILTTLQLVKVGVGTPYALRASAWPISHPLQHIPLLGGTGAEVDCIGTR